MRAASSRKPSRLSPLGSLHCLSWASSARVAFGLALHLAVVCFTAHVSETRHGAGRAGWAPGLCGAESDGALALGVGAKAGRGIRDTEAWRATCSVGGGEARGKGGSSPDQPGPPRSSASDCQAARLSCLLCGQSPGSGGGGGRLSSPQQLHEEGLSFLFRRGRDPGLEGCPVHLGVWSPVLGGCRTCKVKVSPAPAHPNATGAGPPPGGLGLPAEMEQPRFTEGAAGGRHPPGLCFLPCSLPVGLPGVTPGLGGL